MKEDQVKASVAGKGSRGGAIDGGYGGGYAGMTMAAGASGAADALAWVGDGPDGPGSGAPFPPAPAPYRICQPPPLIMYISLCSSSHRSAFAPHHTCQPSSCVAPPGLLMMHC
jgi:hypothetical protein